MAEAPVITIDGPSGTGKGTVAGYLAAWLQWHLLDSGSLYRILALAASRRHLSLLEGARIAALVAELDIRFETRDQAVRVYLDREDASAAIRTEECGSAASEIAAQSAVRAALLDKQRAFRRPPGLVADGRDMGTVVFPDAPVKLYLTASPEQRAKRRYKQLKQKGISVNLDRLSTDIELRDNRDTGRDISPLQPAADATVIDTSLLDVGEVCSHVTDLVRAAMPGLLSK